MLLWLLLLLLLLLLLHNLTVARTQGCLWVGKRLRTSVRGASTCLFTSLSHLWLSPARACLVFDDIE